MPALRDPLKVLLRLALLRVLALELALGFERGLRLAAFAPLAEGRCGAVEFRVAGALA